VAFVTRHRLLAYSVVPPLVVFVVLMGAAMALYPGGTWEDPHAAGHSHLRNFLCDLERPVALNGQPNELGAACATWSLLAFSLALGPFFLIASRVFPDKRRLGVLVGVSGLISCIGGVGIVLMPSHRVGSLIHGLVVLVAAGPGLTAAVSATIATWTTKHQVRAIRVSAAGTLLLSALAVVVFAAQLARGDETTTGLPVLEKLAIVLTMVWMLLTVAEVLRKPATSP
jgi:hypothetical protein